MRIAINGFGRIGRNFLRELVKRNWGNQTIDIVAINDLADHHTLAHLFKYDSIHGVFDGAIEVTDQGVKINDRLIHFTSIKQPANLPWSELSVDVVIESSGHFKTESTASEHLKAGAKKVILSAPAIESHIPTVVLGINDKSCDLSAPIISNASCTTNNAAPLIKMIDDLCEIESAYITTVHSYTTDQKLHDAPHQDLRRARSAPNSIVPTTTGAAKAITRIFPHLNDKIGGCGIRVPVPNGSMTDITCVVKNTKSVEFINQAFERASQHELKGILSYTDEPIVSVDILGNPTSCLFDSSLTSVIGSMVKVVGWYDNEIGYSNRLIDLVLKVR